MTQTDTWKLTPQSFWHTKKYSIIIIIIIIIGVQLPTYTDKVALCAVPQSIDISYGQAHSTKPAATGLLLCARAGQTDGRTDRRVDGWH